ncbi:hypothetical protein VTK73DRAFT_5011 [Phialemonium thermophilum]|uniref:Zn(2)-C6 fungal-type domain-containing protein n=1 Tax=Phialemonium thermophilum TaxID=223376 RepID=A0ABR3WR26_9PEZI
MLCSDRPSRCSVGQFNILFVFFPVRLPCNILLQKPPVIEIIIGISLVDYTMMQESTGRVRKPRSRIACQRCHNRRVRCDVSARGPPCSGCAAGNVGHACRILESKRSRGENGRFSAKASADGGAAATSSPTATSISPMAVGIERQPIPSMTSPYASVQGRGDREMSAVYDDVSREQEPLLSTVEEADYWSKIISRDRAAAPDSRRVAYLGESWTLSYVIQWRSRGSAGAGDQVSGHPSPSDTDDDAGGLHVPVPMEQDTPSPRSAVTSTMMRGQLAPDIQSALVDAYFAHNHTLYPVISEGGFRESMAHGTTSPLLLTAVLYAGALHVADPVIYRAGFDSRQACLRKLYCRAKGVFWDEEDNSDAGDQLSRVQAAFLLHNMWLSPNATLDPWTWLGLAIRLAQNMGMHRSTARSSLKDSDRRLWKRIWWSLYSRDMQMASALGKPPMIRELDCDVEDLDLDDFEPIYPLESRLYVIEQVKLSRICDKIIATLFAPGGRDAAPEPGHKAAIMKELTAWRDHIPEPLSPPRGGRPDQVPLQAMLLQVLFNSLLLLVHRPRLQPISAGGGIENEAESWKITIRAANTITQITESIMNYKSLHHCPLFYTSALFGAMTMHAIRGAAGENQLGLCMIAMRTLATMYWAASWIRNIFQKLGEKKQRSHGCNTPAVPTRAASPTRPTDDATARRMAQRHGGAPLTQLRATASGVAPWSTPGETDRIGSMATYPNLSPQQTNSQATPLPRAPALGDSLTWDMDLSGTAPGVLGSLGRNVGVYIDYPMLDSAGFTGTDPGLADCWQDLLATDNPFNNPFIMNRMPG